MSKTIAKWLSPVGTCDICHTDLSKHTHLIDGRTCYGPWAKMCVKCHFEVGVGLGTGRGQKYLVATSEKVEG